MEALDHWRAARLTALQRFISASRFEQPLKNIDLFAILPNDPLASSAPPTRHPPAADLPLLVVPRRARFTLADIKRATRAAREQGAEAVEVKPDGTIKVVISSSDGAAKCKAEPELPAEPPIRDFKL